MKKEDSNISYRIAKHKVKTLKSFYIHLIVYLIINSGLTLVKTLKIMDGGATFSEAFFKLAVLPVWLIWGIGLGIHAFSVFGIPLMLGNNWESRKIEKYMSKDLENDKD